MHPSLGSRDSSGLRLRLTVCVAAACFVVVGLLGALFYARAQLDARAEFERQGGVRATQLAAMARRPLSDSDTDQLQILAAALAADADVRELAIVDSAGRIALSTRGFAANRLAPAIYRAAAAGAPVRVHSEGTPEAGDGAVLFVAPVSASDGSGVALGSAVLRLSTASLDAGPAHLRIAFAALLGLAVFVAAVHVLLGRLLRPLDELRDAINALSRGELSARVDARRLGPLSHIGEATNRLAERCEQIAARVSAMAERLHAVILRVAEATARMESDSGQQVRAIDDASPLFARMNDSVATIGGEIEKLSRSSKEAAGSVLRMGGSIDEVARSMDSLSQAVESSSASSQQMGAAIHQVAASADEVQRMAEETAASMTEMDRAIQQVGEHVRQASELTERVSTSAEDGSRAVVATIEGIGEIRSLTLDAKSVHQRLAERIGEIGEIVDVIESINDETNLLSLNAAIIAAQAGEQGKAFAVVANHVKTLAQRTAQSTREIERLIRAVQEESRNAMTAMEAGIGAVEAGVDRSRRAGEVLETIRLSASDANNRVAEIARAANEQERNSKYVSEAANRTSAMVMQISGAMSEQSSASQQVLETCEAALEVYRQVHHSMEEQRSTGGFLTERIAAIGELMESIQEELSGHSQTTTGVAQAVERILGGEREGAARVAELSGVVGELRADAEALRTSLAQLRSGDAAGVAPVR